MQQMQQMRQEMEAKIAAQKQQMEQMEAQHQQQMAALQQQHQHQQQQQQQQLRATPFAAAAADFAKAPPANAVGGSQAAGTQQPPSAAAAARCSAWGADWPPWADWPPEAQLLLKAQFVVLLTSIIGVAGAQYVIDGHTYYLYKYCVHIKDWGVDGNSDYKYCGSISTSWPLEDNVALAFCVFALIISLAAFLMHAKELKTEGNTTRNCFTVLCAPVLQRLQALPSCDPARFATMSKAVMGCLLLTIARVCYLMYRVSFGIPAPNVGLLSLWVAQLASLCVVQAAKKLSRAQARVVPAADA